MPTDAWIKKAMEFSKLGRFNVALHCCNRALEEDSDNIDALFYKAAILAKLGQHAEELECYEKITQIDPMNARAWFNKGAILGNFAQYREARAAFEEAARKGHPKAKEAVRDCQAEIDKIEEREKAKLGKRPIGRR